jgi:hypothetical protein
MKNLQKMGGIAALYAGAAYVVGIVGFLFVVDVSSVIDPVQQVALMVDNQAFLHIMHLIVYQVWAIFLVVLTLALYERLKAGSPGIMQTATAIGVIWATLVIASGMIYNIGMDTVVNLYSNDPAQAGTIWLTIDTVFTGIGGGNEIVGGIWIMLLSWAALRVGELPKALNYLGMVVGVAGTLSALPGLSEVGLIFGLGQIVWFIWLGIAMLRSNKSAAAS